MTELHVNALHSLNMNIMVPVGNSVRYMHNLLVNMWIDVDVLIVLGTEFKVLGQRTGLLTNMPFWTTEVRHSLVSLPCTLRFKVKNILEYA